MGVSILLSQGPGDGDHDSAFHPLAEQLAAAFIHTLDRTGGVIGVGSAAAGAVQPCPAVLTLRMGIDIAGGKFILDFLIGHAVPDVAQLVLVLAHELMAGIQVTPGGNGHIFGARSAAGDPLVDAGAALQVDHVMVEGEGSALLMPLEHQLCQLRV